MANQASARNSLTVIHLARSRAGPRLSLTAADWSRAHERFGHLLESWVVQQPTAQAGWTDPDLRFWHYRDKDIGGGRSGHHAWPTDLGGGVKSTMTATPADGAGLRRLAEQCGADYQGGVLLYAGNSAFPLGDARHLAVPLARLWTT